MHRLGERRFEVVVGGLRQHLQAQVREILAQDDEFLRDSQPEDVTFHEITGSTKNGYYFAREILSRRNPSKAYFFQDNRFATGFHRGCLEAGLSIPEDVKFVVGNRVEDTEFSPLHLTTIYPSLDTMAERIVALLQARLQTPKSDLPCQEIFLPQEIELGESTHGGSNHAEG